MKFYPPVATAPRFLQILLTLGLAGTLLHAPLAAGQDLDLDQPIRFATFNAALSGPNARTLSQRLEDGEDPGLKKIAAIVQRVRPDVLLIQEFDHDPTGTLARQFRERYLEVDQGETRAITFDHAYSPPVNTGLPTGLDLDGDGYTDGPADTHGWGKYPGQYGMLLLSRFRIMESDVIDWREKTWGRLPFSLYPKRYYPGGAYDVLRLSSKTHAWVPLRRGDQQFAVLLSHPTPPVFDGEEDRNGRRNFDEIGLLVQMLHRFDGPAVVLGDLNADPADGESRTRAVTQLLEHDRLQDPQPRSDGGAAAATRDRQANDTHAGDPALDTADWDDRTDGGSGNLRVDYVLPTLEWEVTAAGVFWPTPDEADAEWIGVSDHRLVWVEAVLGGPPPVNPRRAPFGR